MSSFDDDMRRLDEGLKNLKIEYNRYFTGALDRPPLELQNSLGAIIRRHSQNPEGRRTAEQFRLNALVSRFHSLTEMWNRNVRHIEEGRPSVLDRRDSATEPTAAGNKGEEEIYRARLDAADSAPENPALQKLYKSYLSAAGRGEGLSGTLSYKNFYDQVHRRMARCQEKNGGSAVLLKVVVVDNRALLKLKSAP